MLTPPAITPASTTALAVVEVVDGDLASALTALDAQQPLSLVCVPWLATLSGDAHREAAASIAAYCAKRRAFLIADPPSDWLTVDDVVRGVDAVRTAIGEQGAVYWPPLKDASLSEAVAGVYVRTDETSGVWKAPAGTNAPVAETPSVLVTDAMNAVLNPLHVNVVRTFPIYGTLVWGARTMASDPELRYVPIKRLLLMIEQSIVNGLSWTETEPNGPALWSAVDTAVNTFLTSLWTAGAFRGSTPSDSFFVSVMTPDDIASGRLIVNIGVAPVAAAEFVMLRIGLWTASRSDDDP
jgi:phage tail sheath protein FI